MVHVRATGIQEEEESHITECPILNTDVETVGKETVYTNGGTSPSYTWKNWEKPGKASVRVTRVPVDIRTQHLSYTIQEHYHHDNLPNLPGVLIRL
jgi:hypothetical protein